MAGFSALPARRPKHAAKRDVGGGYIRLLQCILLEIDANLIYLSIDKFAETSP
jgi:hypothetical protein